MILNFKFEHLYILLTIAHVISIIQDLLQVSMLMSQCFWFGILALLCIYLLYDRIVLASYAFSLQVQHDELEAKFLEERALLEAKYQKLYEPLYTKVWH